MTQIILGCILSSRWEFLFTCAAKHYAGQEQYDGYKTFMGQWLYYIQKYQNALV
jgi:hypothetical protein